MATIQDYMEDDHARWGVLAILLKKIAHFDEKTQGLAQLHLALPLYVGQVIAAKDDGSLDEAAAAFEASPAFVKSLVDFEVGKTRQIAPGACGAWPSSDRRTEGPRTGSAASAASCLGRS